VGLALARPFWRADPSDQRHLLSWGADSPPHRPLARLADLSGSMAGRPRGAARTRRTHQVHARRANVSVRRRTIDREVARGNRRRFV